MACFIVPATEAIFTTVANKVIKSKELKSGEKHNGIALSNKVSWLNKMLWGGSALLAFEHVWHGEVTPYFPFLTNAIDASDRADMLYEMSTSGVAMALVVTAVWAVACVAVSAIEKRADKTSERSI